MDFNCVNNTVLTHYPWSLTPQSPAGPRYGLGPDIRPRVGTSNRAPVYFLTRIRDQLFATRVTPPSQTSFFHRARDNPWRQTEEIFRSKNQGYQCIKQVLDGNQTKMERLKVTDTENSTFAFPYIVVKKMIQN